MSSSLTHTATIAPPREDIDGCTDLDQSPNLTTTTSMTVQGRGRTVWKEPRAHAARLSARLTPRSRVPTHRHWQREDGPVVNSILLRRHQQVRAGC